MSKGLWLAAMGLSLLLPMRIAPSANGTPTLRANDACADGSCIFAANQICGGGTHRRAFQ